jgi:purine-nucleoside phosphorylase
MHKVEEILEAADYIRSKTAIKPLIGIILGSGLGPLADEIEEAVKIPYHDIPYFAKSHAIGHANELVIGKLNGKNVVAMKGRFHYYEGVSLVDLTFPVRVMKELGIEKMLVTNACGAVNTEFKPGDLMLITDHINLVSNNPLIGPNNDALGTRFPDVSEVYNKELRELVLGVATEQGVKMQQGVYAWLTGPCYETPAEIRMIRILGADAVGMSTVPEALIAVHVGIKTVGISCLTNMACGILDQPLNHDEVVEVATLVKEQFTKLVKESIARM